MHSDGRAFASDHFLCFCLEACGTVISNDPELHGGLLLCGSHAVPLDSGYLYPGDGGPVYSGKPPFISLPFLLSIFPRSFLLGP